MIKLSCLDQSQVSLLLDGKECCLQPLMDDSEGNEAESFLSVSPRHGFNVDATQYTIKGFRT